MSDTSGLIAAMQQFITEDGILATPIERLSLVRMSAPTEPLHGIQKPALCIIAQGAKQVIVGDQVLNYDAGHMLVVSVEVPSVGHVTGASVEEPYLCVRLDLDPAMLAAIIVDHDLGGSTRAETSGIGLCPRNPAIIDAVTRLVQLLQSPADIGGLAPLYEREILFRLLTGPQAAQLRQIATGDSRTHQVNRAIGWIKDNFTQPFRIEFLAAEARMSASALHQHFKDVTAMSPLQYQKQLRLQEARRLILSEAMDAASAGFRVGYDSPSQFSREYRRLFGAPPLKDVARLKSDPGRYAEA